MCEPLPERIDAARLARKHGRLSGRIPLSRMPRLAKCLWAEPKGDAAVEAEFSLAAQERPAVHGSATASVQLTCQRCLEAVDWQLEASFSLAVVHDDAEAAALPSEYEPLLWPDDSGSLPEMIEDELLLAMPAIARHGDAAQCGGAAGLAQSDEGEATRDDNPFAVLKQLKDKEE